MKIQKLGLQLYSIRDSLGTAETIRESFHRIKEIGYDVVQTAGCKIPFEEFGQIAKEEGIEICGTHENFDWMTGNPEEAMTAHKCLGAKYMGGGGVHVTSDIAKYLERANTLGSTIYPNGFKFTYHNHSFEFERMPDGRTVMDMLVEGLDPVTTSFCLDSYWLQYAGVDVCQWILKLKNRVDILHLKDMAVEGNDPYITEIGNGNLWWEGILDAAEKSGVKYYIVEQDYCPGDPFDSIKQSSEFLHKYYM